MPKATAADAIMRFQHTVVLALCPVPEPKLAIGIAGHNPAAIRRPARRDGIARIEVALEGFARNELEAPKGLVGNDLVVHRLTNQVLLIRAQDDLGNRMHRWFRDVFDHHRDAKFP